VGLIPIIAVFAFAALRNTDDSPVIAEVAGAVEERGAEANELDVIEPDGADEAVASAEQAPGEQSNETTSQTPEPAPVENVAPESGDIDLDVVVLGEVLELSVYDVDPVNAGTRTFAIRISNGGSEAIPSTDAFEVVLETADGDRLPAFVRFSHQDIPSGSSAIGSVRVEGVPAGPTSAVLVLGDSDIALRELP